MKAKTIKSILSRKFKHWLKSIEDEHLKTLLKRDAIITGGSIVSMLLREKVNDYDVYFKTLETTKAVAEYYVAQFKKNPPTRFKDNNKTVDVRVVVEVDRVKIVVKSSGIAGESGEGSYQYFEQVAGSVGSEQFIEDTMKDVEEATDADKDKPKYRPVFLSSNAISLSHKMQLVVRFYGAVEEIHENYDFTHCTCSWDAETGELRLPAVALQSMLARELHYTHSKYPLCSIIRTRKFIDRGWTINAGQYVKMAWDLNALDLTQIDVLEDQMIGVDSSYFLEVLELLRQKDSTEVDGTYLIQVIDKVFG